MKGLHGKLWKRGALTMLTLSLLLGGCTNVAPIPSDQEESLESIKEQESTGLPESETGSAETAGTSEESTSAQDPGGNLAEGLGEDAVRLFESITGWEFIFESGVGGWCTTVTVDGEGNFSGQFHDGDLGDVGEGYDNGTIYTSIFTGKFTEVKKLSDYVYEARVTDLTYENEPETIEISDGVRWVYSEAYGLDKADVVKIYLPGAKLAELPTEYAEWIEPLHFGAYVYGTFYRDFPEELPFCGIYEPNEKDGFYSVNYHGKNSLYVVNEATFPGMKNVRSELNEDGTYFYQDLGEYGLYEVTNTCYYSDKNFSTYDSQTDFVRDAISHFVEGRDYDNVIILDSGDADSSPQMIYLHGDVTYLAGWTCGTNEDTRQYVARMISKGNYVYVYGFSYSEYDEFMQGEAGYFMLSSLTYSGDPGRLSTSNGDGVVKKILAGVTNNGADPSMIFADECIWVSSWDEELMAKYHLTEDDVPNDYAIVEMDGNYKAYRLSDSCPIYIQYPVEGPFWELQNRATFHNKMADNKEPFLMELYLDENDVVTFMYEPFRP